jgi:UDP-N-acetylglucosamine acyltransferase
MIHETAIIDSKAKIDSNVSIGPYTVIKGNVSIGSGTVIGPHVVIDSFTKIGSDCQIFQFASIGAPPQAVKFKGEETWVKIGQGTVVREFATINRGTGFGGGITEVGEQNFLMAYIHVAHDCKTGKGVTLANAATLAGHVTLGNYVTVGGLTAIHQFVRIGDYAYVGGASGIAKDIPPFMIATGNRAHLHGLNKVGLTRHGFSENVLQTLKKAYRIFFRFGLTLNEAIERVKTEVDQIPEVIHLVDFIKTSERGITR